MICRRCHEERTALYRTAPIGALDGKWCCQGCLTAEEKRTNNLDVTDDIINNS